MLVGQSVDDGNGGVLGKFSNILVAEASVGHPSKKPREHLGGVANRFRLAKLDVVFEQRECTATESLNADLKGNPCSCGWFFIDGADGKRVKWEEVQRHLVTLFPKSFEFNGPLQNGFKVVLHVVDGQQVLYHAVSTARRLLSVVRSVLFVLDIGSETVSSIAHASEKGLRKGQNVSESFLKLRRQRRKSGGLGKFLHHAELIDGKFRSLAAGLVVQGQFKNFQSFGPFEDLVQFFGFKQVGF